MTCEARSRIGLHRTADREVAAELRARREVAA
jgi:hypothetical protein